MTDGSDETEWTTVEMMEIPADVNLLETNNKKKKRGSIIRSSRSEDESEDESEVEVIDSEGEPSDEEEHPLPGIASGDQRRSWRPVSNGGQENNRDSLPFDVSARVEITNICTISDNLRGYIYI